LKNRTPIDKAETIIPGKIKKNSHLFEKEDTKVSLSKSKSRLKISDNSNINISSMEK